MANFAAILGELTVSGSRKSDGTANASGLVYAYRPGTLTTVSIYSDAEATTIATQPIVLDSGGRVPRSDYPDGLFITQPVRLLIQDSATPAATVSDSVYVPGTAGAVGVDNDGFTDSTMDGVLDKAFTSFGGQDWLVKESLGATSRTIKAKIFEDGISVKDFGAVGDGVAIDTTAIQAAVSRAVSLLCNCIFPDGTYKTDQAITVAASTGVKLIGQGRGTTIIAPTHATANAFTFTAAASSGISGMSILHTSGSTGAAVAIGGASPNFKARDLYIPANGTYAGFAYALDFSGASDFDEVAYCDMNADTVGLRADCSSASKPALVLGCLIGASGLAPVSPVSGIEFNGSNGYYTILGTRAYGASNNILFNASWTGTTVRIYGGDIATTNGSAPLNMAGLAADRDIRWLNCGVDGYTVNVLSGATATPDRSQGPHIRIRGTTTGAAYVVAAPTPAPSLGSTRDIDLYLTFYNNAGGAVTGWTLNAAYHMAAVSTTNLEMTSYHLKWDADIQVWREFSRAVTT